MSNNGRDYSELARLIGLLRDDRISAPEMERLESLLLNDPGAQRFYHEYIALGVDLAWMPLEVQAAHPDDLPQDAPPGAESLRFAWRRWLLRGAVASTLAAAILLAVALLSPRDQRHANTSVSETARVVELFGEARVITANGESLPLAEGQAIARGQVLNIGNDDSYLTLEYPDATRLILSPGTLVQLPGGRNHADRGKRLFLFKGFLQVEQPREKSDRPLILASPHAEVSASGSKVNFWSSPEETRVEAEKGNLRLTRRRDGHSVEVLHDSFIIISPDEPDLRPRPLPAQTKARAVLSAGTGPVLSLAFRRDGRTLATGGWKGQVQFWDVSAAREIGQPLQAHKRAVRALGFSPDGTLLATAADERGRLKLWNVETRLPGPPLKGHRTSPVALEFSPDGKALVTVSGSGRHAEVKVWDPATGALRFDLKGHTREVMAVAFSADGKLLATASRDRTVKLWDAVSGAEVRTLVAQQGELRALAFALDGRTLATGGQDGTVTVWDVAGGQERLKFHAYPRMVKCLAFSPDGKLLASGGETPVANLWDAATGREVAALRIRGYTVFAVRFSPDGRTLAVAGSRGNVELWDVPRQVPIHHLRGAQAPAPAALLPTQVCSALPTQPRL